MARWYKGDTHMHTVNSDGILRLYELIEQNKKHGMDWIIVTDHNYDTISGGSYSSDGLTVIRGQEITVKAGHVNVWGEKVPLEPPYAIETAEEYAAVIEKCNDAGAVTCANHPFCSQCGFRVDVNLLPVKCVEVWNTIQHSDNVKNMQWWDQKLREGSRLAAVGGSDFHRSYGPLDMIAMPTTVTYANSLSPADILKALTEGRSVVTNKPDSSMIYLNIGEAMLGDTVYFKECMRGRCVATKLMPSFSLRIYNNDKLVYQHKAKRYEKEHICEFQVLEKGYVRAQIDFDLTKQMRSVVGYAEKKYLTSKHVQVSSTAETFFWAFTNPIWID